MWLNESNLDFFDKVGRLIHLTFYYVSADITVMKMYIEYAYFLHRSKMFLFYFNLHDCT